ncbi:MAG: DUF2520 domain-containing protein [Sphingomonadales bacterium]|nr:DUF2520 domain-containing protein [Sphingomonadales bacterium]
MSTKPEEIRHPCPDRLIIVGSGHLAWQMGEALINSGVTCVGVLARKRSSASALATRLGTVPLDSDPTLWPEAEFVLLAVSDSAICECAQRIPVRSAQILVHASGSGTLSQLSPHPRCGILWPLAALRRERSPDWPNTPLFVEGSESECTGRILELAQRISGVVIQAEAPIRHAHHLSAVSSANFTLFLLAETSEWLRAKGGNPRLLSPILHQVLSDFLEESNLHDRQTGPASRGDYETVEQQWREVYEQPALAALYRLFSDLICLKHASTKR